MTDFPFDIVGFDLDGTLLETHQDLGTAVNHALAMGGFMVAEPEEARHLIGGGAKAMLKKAIDAQGGTDPDEFERLYKGLLEHYGAHYADHTKPFPGAIEALDTLAARGVRIAVVTNKFESFATGVLDALGLSDRFDCVIGGNTLGKGPDGKTRAKPAPEPIHHAIACCGGGSFVFVGDSSYDMKAARAAGVPAVLACYGYCDGTARELGADAVIDSLHELIPVLEALGGAHPVATA